MTTSTLLTPHGTGAIATLRVEGADAWSVLRKLFSKSLPEVPPLHHHWYGRLAGDDVILAVLENHFEIHCHGGVKIVELIQHTLGEIAPKPTRSDGWTSILQARTLRTASILLDQIHGAFQTSVAAILAHPDLEGLEALAQFAPLGSHLIEPWKIAIAGAPNVGKSSLINALVGYERAVVSPVAGTTRDAVATLAAFDGWPLELTDTAGLRDTSDELESLGIDRAKSILETADAVVWVIDASVSPTLERGVIENDTSFARQANKTIKVANKCDLAPAPAGFLGVSAKTCEGVPSLIAKIVRTLVPVAPLPGEAVPYTPELAGKVVEARMFASTGKVAAARQTLESCSSTS